jgi:hypothetical protein
VGSTSHLQSINCKQFVHLRVHLKFTSPICVREDFEQRITLW